MENSTVKSWRGRSFIATWTRQPIIIPREHARDYRETFSRQGRFFLFPRFS